MSAEADKIILKEDSLPGVVKGAHNDFSLASDIPPAWTVITKSMWKKKGLTFVGVKQFANEVGDIIQMGKLGKKYRILQFVKREGTRMGKGGDILRIKRIDNNTTTNPDLENSLKGDKVLVMGRKSYIRTLDHPWGRDYVEPCKEECKTTLPCDGKDEDCDC